MKTLLLTLLFCVPVIAQSDLSKFDVVGKNGISAYLVQTPIKKEKEKVDFVLLVAKIIESTDDVLTLDPKNYVELHMNADCKRRTYRVLSQKGRADGVARESKGSDAVYTAKPETAIEDVLIFVCKEVSVSI